MSNLTPEQLAAWRAAHAPATVVEGTRAHLTPDAAPVVPTMLDANKDALGMIELCPGCFEPTEHCDGSTPLCTATPTHVPANQEAGVAAGDPRAGAAAVGAASGTTPAENVPATAAPLAEAPPRKPTRPGAGTSSLEHAALEERVVMVNDVEMVVRDGMLVPLRDPEAHIIKPKKPRAPRQPATPDAPEQAELAAARKRGENNEGERVYDVVLAMTESQRAELSRDLAALQRRMGTRSVVGTLVRAVHLADGLQFVDGEKSSAHDA